MKKHCSSSLRAVLAGAALFATGCDTSPADSLVKYEPKVIVSAVSATGHDRFYNTALDAQGGVYAVGQVAQSTEATADYSTVVAKFTPDGELDPSFGEGGRAILNVAVGTSGEAFRGIVVQSDGKVVIGGTIEHAGAADVRDRDMAVVRFTAAGAPDPSFGTGGVVILDLSEGEVVGTGFVADSGYGLARYPDDRLVVSGGMKRMGATDTDFALVRLSKDGVRDASFGTNGVFSLHLQVVDETNGNALVENNASPRFLTILPGTQGILGAGYQPIPGKDTSPVVYKVTDAGLLDTSFGGGTGAFTTAVLSEQSEVYDVSLQGEKIVTTGYGKSTAAEGSDILSLRLNADGTLDTTYGQQGMVRIDVAGFGDNSRLVKVLPDKRVLLTGSGRTTADNMDAFVAILTADGQPDTSFSATGYKLVDAGGVGDVLWGMALSADGKTLFSAGIRGVGTTPAAGANDDAMLTMMKLVD